MKKVMTTEEKELYNDLKMLVKRANQRLLRIERLTAEKDSFASKQLFDYLSSEKLKAVVKQEDEATKQAIKDYALREYPNQNVRVDFLNKDTVDEIIKLGIAEYQRKKVGDSSGKKKEV